MHARTRPWARAQRCYTAGEQTERMVGFEAGGTEMRVYQPLGTVEALELFLADPTDYLGGAPEPDTRS